MSNSQFCNRMKQVMEAFTSTETSAEDYDALVRKILDIPALAQGIGDMIEEEKGVNLVSTDWKQRLDGYPLLQTFLESEGKYIVNKYNQNDALQYEAVKGLYPDVLVAGRWQLRFGNYRDRNAKEVCVEFRESEALNQMARYMTSDLDQATQLSESFKFHIEKCAPYSCCFCRKLRATRAAQGVTIPKESQWCVLKTKFYDGEKIHHVFQSEMEDAVRGVKTIIGIIRVKIVGRSLYKYNEIPKVKIIGGIKDMLLFKEENLFPLDETKIPASFLQSLNADLESTVPRQTLARETVDEEYFDTIGLVEKHKLDDFDLIETIPAAKMLKSDDDSREKGNNEDDDNFLETLGLTGKHRMEDEEENIIETIPSTKRSEPEKDEDWCVREEKVFIDE